MHKRTKTHASLPRTFFINPLEGYVGKKLKTVQALDPGGFVVKEFGTEWLSAKSETDFIPKDTWVQVIKYDYQQQKLVVRQL